MGRTADRRDFDMPTRTTLLEHDADVVDETILAVSGRLDGMQRVLVGILVATATASILLAINIVVNVASNGGGP